MSDSAKEPTDMENVSLEPMKFGTVNEFRIALTELRWIKKDKGKLADNDIATVARKYNFPIGFLRDGLEGLSYPDDYLVSKSRWFPIIYSWVVHERQLSINLLKLQFDYVQTRFRSLNFFGVLVLVSFFVGSTLQSLFKLDPLQLLSLVIIPFALSLVALCVEMRHRVAETKNRMDDYSAHLEEMGLRHIIYSNERFIQEHMKFVLYAGNILLKKFAQSPNMVLIPLGVVEEAKEPRRKMSRLRRLLSKIRLLPKSTTMIEREKIPAFYGENSDQEYEKRIRDLTKE